MMYPLLEAQRKLGEASERAAVLLERIVALEADDSLISLTRNIFMCSSYVLITTYLMHICLFYFRNIRRSRRTRHCMLCNLMPEEILRLCLRAQIRSRILRAIFRPLNKHMKQLLTIRNTNKQQTKPSSGLLRTGGRTRGAGARGAGEARRGLKQMKLPHK